MCKQKLVCLFCEKIYVKRKKLFKHLTKLHKVEPTPEYVNIHEGAESSSESSSDYGSETSIFADGVNKSPANISLNKKESSSDSESSTDSRNKKQLNQAQLRKDVGGKIWLSQNTIKASDKGVMVSLAKKVPLSKSPVTKHVSPGAGLPPSKLSSANKQDDSSDCSSESEDEPNKVSQMKNAKIPVSIKTPVTVLKKTAHDMSDSEDSEDSSDSSDSDAGKGTNKSLNKKPQQTPKPAIATLSKKPAASIKSKKDSSDSSSEEETSVNLLNKKNLLNKSPSKTPIASNSALSKKDSSDDSSDSSSDEESHVTKISFNSSMNMKNKQSKPNTPQLNASASKKPRYSSDSSSDDETTNTPKTSLTSSLNKKNQQVKQNTAVKPSPKKPMIPMNQKASSSSSSSEDEDSNTAQKPTISKPSNIKSPMNANANPSSKESSSSDSSDSDDDTSKQVITKQNSLKRPLATTNLSNIPNKKKLATLSKNVNQTKKQSSSDSSSSEDETTLRNNFPVKAKSTVSPLQKKVQEDSYSLESESDEDKKKKKNSKFNKAQDINASKRKKINAESDMEAPDAGFQPPKKTKKEQQAFPLNQNIDDVKQYRSRVTSDSTKQHKVHDQQNVGRGRGRPNDSNGSNFGANPRGSRLDVPEIQYAVPANKCGLVIGKDAAAWAAYYSQYYGQQQAHPMQPSTGQLSLQPGVAPQPGLPSQPNANQAANQQPAADAAAWAAYDSQYYGQQQAHPMQPSTGQLSLQPGVAPQPGLPSQPNANQAANQQPAADAAAWAAYDSQYYGQQQAHPMQPSTGQLSLQPGVAPQPGLPSQPNANQAANQQPAADAAAWAAYDSQYYGQQQAHPMQPSTGQLSLQPGVAPQPGLPSQPNANQAANQQPAADAAAWAAYDSQYYGQQQAHPMQPSTGQLSLQPGVAPQPGLPSQPNANQAANQQPAADAAAWAAYDSQYYGQQQAHPMQPSTGQLSLQPGVAPQPGLPSQPNANQAANQQPAADAAAWAAYDSQYYGQQQAHPMQPSTGQLSLQPGVAPQPGLPSQPNANQAANQQPAADAAAWAAYDSQYYGQQQAHPMQPSTGQLSLQPGVAPQPGLPSQPNANQAANQQPAAGMFRKDEVIGTNAQLAAATVMTRQKKEERLIEELKKENSSLKRKLRDAVLENANEEYRAVVKIWEREYREISEILEEAYLEVDTLKKKLIAKNHSLHKKESTSIDASTQTEEYSDSDAESDASDSLAKLSPVSSVHTSDLSSFDDQISLSSEDEQGKKKTVPLKEALKYLKTPESF